MTDINALHCNHCDPTFRDSFNSLPKFSYHIVINNICDWKQYGGITYSSISVCSFDETNQWIEINIAMMRLIPSLVNIDVEMYNNLCYFTLCVRDNEWKNTHSLSGIWTSPNTTLSRIRVENYLRNFGSCEFGSKCVGQNRVFDWLVTWIGL